MKKFRRAGENVSMKASSYFFLKIRHGHLNVVDIDIA